MKHTETPWESSKHGTPEHSPQYGIHAGGNDFVIVKGDNAKENTAFILKACNSYNALLETLQSALHWNDIDIESYDDLSPNMDMLEERKKALKAAISLIESFS